MKKFFAMVLMLCLMCGATALADNQTVTEESTTAPQTVLSVELDESYTVVIPATLSIPANATMTDLPIEVTSLHLKPARTDDSGTWVSYLGVVVRDFDNKDGFADSSFIGKLSSGNTATTIDYSIGGSDTTPVISLRFDECAKKNFTINIDAEEWANAPAGNYTSTLTFFVGIWVGNI